MVPEILHIVKIYFKGYKNIMLSSITFIHTTYTVIKEARFRICKSNHYLVINVLESHVVPIQDTVYLSSPLSNV